MATHRVGGEVDAFCTRCRLTLAHTILAMVGTKIARVRCNTCGGDHAFRAEPGSRARSSAPREPRAQKVIVPFDQRLAAKDLSKARRYSAKDTYSVEEVVNHPNFGLGIVSAVRGDKVDVAFKAFEKTLVHGRGEGGPARASFNPPRPGASGPADKPAEAPADSPPPAEPGEAPPAEPRAEPST
ncbi:MAG: hypothetical protein HYZ28_12325 [Myxococcales bacterium]|nr:hypothetical protein [Myxococcales bacterium]